MTLIDTHQIDSIDVSTKLHYVFGDDNLARPGGFVECDTTSLEITLDRFDETLPYLHECCMSINTTMYRMFLALLYFPRYLILYYETDFRPCVQYSDDSNSTVVKNISNQSPWRAYHHLSPQIYEIL